LTRLEGERARLYHASTPVAETRQTYDGPLVVGDDLMSFEIAETVTVKPFKP